MILSEETIELSDSQLRFLKSGWGDRVLNEVIVKKITYESGDLNVNGFIAKPKDVRGDLPLIIWNRGGNRKEGMIDDFLARGIFGEIASWGYIVLASQYRNNDEFGGRDVEDVLSLVELADKIPNCDSSRIGMEGWSRGGMMTYIVLSKTDKVKCAVFISGLADLFRSEKNRSGLAKVYRELFGIDDETEFKKRMEERSAVHFADSISKDTKVLLIHGTADDKVSHEDSVDMFSLLSDIGIETELKLVDDGDHYLKKDRKKIARLRREWFDKYLKN